MGWSYRKKINILPGVSINLSNKGVSTTIRGKGTSVNIGKNGTYLNTGIPGTGIRNRQRLDTPQRNNFAGQTNNQNSGCAGMLAIIFIGICAGFIL